MLRAISLADTGYQPSTTAIPMPFTQRNLGSRSVDYAKHLEAEGLIRLPKGHIGTKPPAHTEEIGQILPEPSETYEAAETDPPPPLAYAKWFMSEGGFRDALDFDSNHWSPLMQATNAAAYSPRCLKAAIELVSLCSECVNRQTIGLHPSGYSALHIACDGSDKGLQRIGLVHALLVFRAEIDIRDNKGNTPFLLAAGSGITDTALALIHAGCDRNATNRNGQGALQKAKMCSGSLSQTLIELDVRMTRGTSGRTRQSGSCSDTRMARYVHAHSDTRIMRQLDDNREWHGSGQGSFVHLGNNGNGDRNATNNNGQGGRKGNLVYGGKRWDKHWAYD